MRQDALQFAQDVVVDANMEDGHAAKHSPLSRYGATAKGQLVQSLELGPSHDLQPRSQSWHVPAPSGYLEVPQEATQLVLRAYGDVPLGSHVTQFEASPPVHVAHVE